MIKKDLIKSISLATGVDRKKASIVVEAFCKIVINTLKDGTRIDIRGFGSFYPKKRKAKVARNISTNTALFLEEKVIPSFKPSKTFIDIIKKIDPEPKTL